MLLLLTAAVSISSAQTVKVTQNEDGSWQFTEPRSAYLISAKLLDITINPLKHTDFIYDGEPKKPEVTAQAGTKVISGDKCRPKYPDDCVSPGVKTISSVEVWNNAGNYVEIQLENPLTYTINEPYPCTSTGR